jgi:hypothetical protein
MGHRAPGRTRGDRLRFRLEHIRLAAKIFAAKIFAIKIFADEIFPEREGHGLEGVREQGCAEACRQGNAHHSA